MFQSVLVVCVGNVCRSPVGARVLAEALPGFEIGSAGLGALVGQPADPVTAAAASACGIDLTGHQARQMTAELGARHELILVMERAHRREVAARFSQLGGRTMLFGQWLEGGVDVPDPYRRPEAVHAATVELIRRAAAEWLLRLKR